MGRLPAECIIPSTIFNYITTEFCGPFLIRYNGQRKGTFHKLYLVLFKCFIKVIHLKLLSELTKDTFFATMKIFITRHRKCTVIFFKNTKTSLAQMLKCKKLIRYQRIQPKMELIRSLPLPPFPEQLILAVCGTQGLNQQIPSKVGCR